MDLRYIKTVSDEEIIAELISESDTHYVLRNPLQIDYGEYEGQRHAFMSRWNPYSIETEVRVARISISYVTEVKDVIKRYYVTSLNYCASYCDGIFEKRMNEADAIVKNWPDEDDEESNEMLDSEGLNPPENVTFH